MRTHYRDTYLLLVYMKTLNYQQIVWIRRVLNTNTLPAAAVELRAGLYAEHCV